DRGDQARALALFQKLGLEEPLKSTQMHKDIIDRFGRFPFRNEPLGRRSSDAEREFMRTHKPF
ncbi:MAG TPA: DUF924 family protein, partial [Rhizomicrobium sp.]|nr:DUF924 family protein [Rhizomicrobium sp.]